MLDSEKKLLQSFMRSTKTVIRRTETATRHSFTTVMAVDFLPAKLTMYEMKRTDGQRLLYCCYKCLKTPHGVLPHWDDEIHEFNHYNADEKIVYSHSVQCTDYVSPAMRKKLDALAVVQQAADITRTAATTNTQKTK